jgi:hypothetical protein
MTNRLRVLTDWTLGMLTPSQDVRLRPVYDDEPEGAAPLPAPRVAALH